MKRGAAFLFVFFLRFLEGGREGYGKVGRPCADIFCLKGRRDGGSADSVQFVDELNGIAHGPGDGLVSLESGFCAIIFLGCEEGVGDGLEGGIWGLDILDVLFFIAGEGCE